MSRGSKVQFRETFSSHFSVTTSGFFSNPALLCTMQELGIDRIMFSIDWPFVKNTTATEWLKTVPLCAEDKVKADERQREAVAEDQVGHCAA